MSLKAFSLFFVFSLNIAQASDSIESIEPPTSSAEKPTRIYKLETSENKKTKPVGTLTFADKKDHVLLELEATGLRKGHYQIVKVPECDRLRRTLLSNKVPSGLTEIYSFETDYGELSTEKRLDFPNIDALGLEGASVALLKKEKKELRYIACTPTNP